MKSELAEAQAEARAAAILRRSVARRLYPDRPHTFLANDAVEAQNTSAGTACTVGAGDAIQLNGGLPGEGESASVVVRASRSTDCAVGSTVTVSVQDLVEMHNSMRENLEQGLETLRTSQGTNHLPELPEDAAGTPSSPPSAPPCRPIPTPPR